MAKNRCHPIRSRIIHMPTLYNSPSKDSNSRHTLLRLPPSDPKTNIRRQVVIIVTMKAMMRKRKVKMKRLSHPPSTKTTAKRTTAKRAPLLMKTQAIKCFNAS